MWTRAGLKENTKSMLKFHYWKIFAVTAILMFIGGGFSSITSTVTLPFQKTVTDNFSARFDDYSNNFSREYSYDSFDDFVNGFSNDFGNSDLGNFIRDNFAAIIAVIIGASLIFLILHLAFFFFVVNPITLGANKFIVNAFKNKDEFSDIGYSFKGSHYLSVVKTMALTNVFLALWTLLFWIPGIIKSYSYRMVPYILTDNPKIGARRAITLSRQMMHGEKFNTFVLDLSFIGWYLLGALACGIGVLFVPPYHMSTVANLYLVLRDKAIVTGLTNYEELGYARPASVNDGSVPPAGYNDPNYYTGAGVSYQPPFNPYMQPPVSPPQPPQATVQPSEPDVQPSEPTVEPVVETNETADKPDVTEETKPDTSSPTEEENK